MSSSSLKTLRPVPRRRNGGFSLVELMVSIVISLILLIALGAMFLNISSASNELAKANNQIENGRFAVQVLENELVHAGFWGQFVPQFDDVNWTSVPADTPTQVPDPCLAYSAGNWTTAYVDALLGIPVQSSYAAPGTCALAGRRANTDVLVVRHAAPCTAGEANCDAEVAGKLYFQSSQCSAGTAGTAQALGNSASAIALALPSASSSTSSTDNAYNGMQVRLTGGTGAGQSRTIASYSASTGIATVSQAWATPPDGTTTYVIVEDLLATNGFSLHERGADCATAPAALKRKFVSNIFFIRDYADTAGDGIPTLVRSEFDPSGTPALAHQAAVALVPGIERFAVELGVDNSVARCGLNTAVDYSQPVAKVDPASCAANVDSSRNTLPTNRGDGNPDQFIRCTAAAPCTPAQLANVVAVKLYVLVRNTETSAGYTDTKTYCMSSLDASGNCPAANLAGPFNDRYKRHIFTTTVRLTNVSGRRETQ
jgi:prepilin-type N-terminal cleavage/methylation domain-containing protein